MSDFSVAVFFRGTSINDAPFDKEEYRQSYFELNHEIEALGGEMLITRDQQTYRGNGRFSRVWKMTAPDQYTQLPQQQVSVVFDKGGFETDNKIPQFNHPDINRICADKNLTYSMFSEFSPTTFLVHNQNEFEAALSQIKTQKAVVKPPDGFEGYGILIEDMEQLMQQKNKLTFPTLVQEFMDTSQGIPSIVEGYHDLRTAIFDGEIVFTYVRTPPPGKLTANVAQGGSFRMIPPEKLPSEVLPIIKQIDRQLAYVGERFYSIDLAITPEGPKLIEMNSRVGIFPNRHDNAFHVLKKRLARTFQIQAEKKL